MNTVFPAWKRNFYSRIFLCQFVDHALALALGTLWILVALTMAREVGGKILWTDLSQWSLFVGLGGLVFSSEMALRIFSILFFGQTIGQKISGLRPLESVFGVKFWAIQFFDSFHVVVPAFWALDWVLRIRGWNFLGLGAYEWNTEART
jgi:hypothetical protein